MYPLSDKGNAVAYKNVKCPIAPPEEPYGTFSNSFMVSGDGAEVLLDFCLFSEAEGKAKVVSRVRLSRSFISVVHQKLGDTLKDQKPEPPVLVLPGSNEFN